MNTLYAPAWNVVVVSYSSPDLIYNDVVLYGYAFRSRWMWFNGYINPQIEGKSFSFVIWKDYNCHTWGGISGITGFNSSQKAVI